MTPRAKIRPPTLASNTWAAPAVTGSIPPSGMLPALATRTKSPGIFEPPLVLEMAGGEPGLASCSDQGDALGLFLHSVAVRQHHAVDARQVDDDWQALLLRVCLLFALRCTAVHLLPDFGRV